jgi:DNA-binding Lrp family transcriptional regulator
MTDMINGIPSTIASSSNRRVSEDTNMSKSEWKDLVDRMKANGISLTIIVLVIYVKAMDHVSTRILLITHETEKLSSIMSDLLSLTTSLSKIQNQLGAKKEVTQEDWNKFDGKHLKQIRDSYTKLIEDCKKLKETSMTQPDFKPMVTAVEGVIDDFDTKIGDSKFSEDINKWQGDTSFQKDQRGTLQGDVVWLAKQFYEKNYDTDNKKGIIDYLSLWVQNINAAQQLGQGMSQQKVVDLQAQMQFISSFSTSGQESARAGKEELSVMVQHQTR